MRTFACSLRAWCDHISKKTARHHCAVFAVWKKNRQRLIVDARIPNTVFEAPDPVALATGQSFARVNVHTNDPIYVSDVDIQVAFYATGLLEPFQDIFAIDCIDAWEVDFARVVEQGIVDSWNDMVYPVLAVVPLGWTQALSVWQWVRTWRKEYRVSVQRIDSLVLWL